MIISKHLAISAEGKIIQFQIIQTIPEAPGLFYYRAVYRQRVLFAQPFFKFGYLFPAYQRFFIHHGFYAQY